MGADRLGCSAEMRTRRECSAALKRRRAGEEEDEGEEVVGDVVEGAGSREKERKGRREVQASIGEREGEGLCEPPLPAPLLLLPMPEVDGREEAGMFAGASAAADGAIHAVAGAAGGGASAALSRRSVSSCRIGEWVSSRDSTA